MRKSKRNKIINLIKPKIKQTNRGIETHIQKGLQQQLEQCLNYKGKGSTISTGQSWTILTKYIEKTVNENVNQTLECIFSELDDMNVKTTSIRRELVHLIDELKSGYEVSINNHYDYLKNLVKNTALAQTSNSIFETSKTLLISNTKRKLTTYINSEVQKTNLSQLSVEEKSIKLGKKSIGIGILSIIIAIILALITIYITILYA